jgi:ubiquinone/menaquinone biosynthesis C-methylase UbiE
MLVASERDFYDEVAEWLPSSRFIFLNYGYADPSDSCQWVASEDQEYTHHLNLVKHVMSGVELAGQIVLEVGFGRGGNCYYLSRYTQANRIYGIDKCQANLRFCQAVHSLHNVTFLKGDAEQLPFHNESFDVVLNLESSHCYPHFDRFLAEVYRVLKPQGMFCYADLWFLKSLELDWTHREQALAMVPLKRLWEEDISGPVFQALKSKEGFVERIRAMADERNLEFVGGVVERLKAVRFLLAAGQFTYKAWRFQKP